MFRLKVWINNFLFSARFIFGGAGSQYGVGVFQRLGMVLKFRRNCSQIKSFTSWTQHVLLAENILRIPSDMNGDVVECGCFNGGSTASLSLACAATGRKLFVCDSFEGLPDPRAKEKDEFGPNRRTVWTYDKGDLSSADGLEGVKDNVTKFGEVGCCEFVKGYFADSLRVLPAESVVMVFEDADLRSSVEDCVRYLWPKMREGSRFYSHEPWSIQVVSLFYDHKWWQETLESSPPGFIGSGDGVREVLVPSMVGFAVKFDFEKAKKNLKRFDDFKNLGSKQRDRAN